MKIYPFSESDASTTFQGAVTEVCQEIYSLAACRRERVKVVRAFASRLCSVDGPRSLSRLVVGCRTRILDAAPQVPSGHRPAHSRG